MTSKMRREKRVQKKIGWGKLACVSLDQFSGLVPLDGHTLLRLVVVFKPLRASVPHE